MKRPGCSPLRRLLLLLILGLGSGPDPAAALPSISEVLYDAEGADNGRVFVELYGDPGSGLDGLVLEGVNGADGSVTVSLLLSGSIPGDGFFVVADDAGAGSSDVPGADLILDFDLQNGPDSLLLRDGPAVLDAVGYGSFGPGDFFAGEGTPAPDAPAGSSLARRFADVDTDDNFADFEVRMLPSPGTGPTVVPEPGTALLLGTALTLLVFLGRRPRARAP